MAGPVNPPRVAVGDLVKSVNRQKTENLSRFRKVTQKVKLSEDINEEKVDIFESEWYRKTKAKTIPGDNLKIYREMHRLTQGKLSEILGGILRQHISNMERGIRSISLKTAQKLSQIFKISVAKFI